MTNEGTIKRRKGFFENRNQILPNAIVFSNLTDSSMRLMAALNAYPENWVLHLKEIRNRLSWGKERMESAIKDCEKKGYLKTTQTRDENGRFNPKEFEFELYPYYLNGYDENSPHDACEPKRVDPTSEDSVSVSPPISSSIEYSNTKEERKEEDQFLPFSPDEDEQEKIQLLQKYSLPQTIVSKIISYSLDRIKTSIRAYDQWVEYRGNPPIDIVASIMKAIINEWKPKLTREEIQAIQEEEVDKFVAQIDERRAHIKQLEKVSEGKLPFKYTFKTGQHEVVLRLDNGFYPISYSDEDVIKLVQEHIDKYWIK